MPKHYPAGRPTVATDENVAKAWTYANGAWATDWDGTGAEVMPTVEGCADYLDISVETCYARQEFSEVLKAIKRRQAKRLINKGAIGEYNPVISKLLLASKHGYVERTATESETLNKNLNQDVTDVSTEDLEARVTALRAHQAA